MWGLGREARHEARFRSHLRSFAGDAKLGRAGGSRRFHFEHQRDRPVVHQLKLHRGAKDAALGA